MYIIGLFTSAVRFRSLMSLRTFCSPFVDSSSSTLSRTTWYSSFLGSLYFHICTFRLHHFFFSPFLFLSFNLSFGHSRFGMRYVVWLCSVFCRSPFVAGPVSALYDTINYIRNYRVYSGNVCFWMLPSAWAALVILVGSTVRDNAAGTW